MKKKPEKHTKISVKRVPVGRPWRQGESGNPAGRPPGPLCLTSQLKQQLDEPCPSDRQRRTWAAVLIEKFLELALEGNMASWEQLWNRVDGTLQQRLSLEQKPEIRIVRLTTEAECAASWEAECAEALAAKAEVQSEVK